MGKRTRGPCAFRISTCKFALFWRASSAPKLYQWRGMRRAARGVGSLLVVPERVVVLSCHISRWFDAIILSLALFALRRFHPTCKVVVVDNSSPIPITQDSLPAVTWMHTNVAIVLNSPSRTREYGAYAKGLAFLASSVGNWSLERHEQFVFMQGSIILTQPIPTIGMAEADGRRCAMKPLYVFAAPRVSITHSNPMRLYLSRVGLNNVSSEAVDGPQEPFVSHSSVLATLDGARLLLRPPSGAQSVFGAVEPMLSSKDFAEALAGVIVNRISLIASNGAATGCAASSATWEASRAGSYIEDAQPAYLNASIGYRKVHCSDWMRMSASDVAFAGMISLADEDQDGLMSRSELARSMTERATAWAYALRATCLTFPFGRDRALRSFVERGPAWPGMGEPLVSIVRSARRRHQREGAISPPCIFWAEEALALNFVLPATLSMLPSQIGQAADALIGALTRKPSRQNRFWWRNVGHPRQNGSDAVSRSDHDGATLKALHGRELAEILFAMSDTDGDGLVSFDDMKVAVTKPGSISSTLVPACWRAGGWLGALLKGGRTSPGLAAGVPQLAPDQLAAVDLQARLRSLQARAKPWNFWHTSEKLSPSLSAGSLLYARAALCCERCGDRDEGCRSFGSADPSRSCGRV